MMTLQQLRVFWAVVHSPSLTQAAKQLGLSQPSLSQHLARLEGALGGRLFDRTNNQLILSDAGRYVLKKAEAILAEVDEIEAGVAAFRTGRRGRIAIGVLGSLGRALVPPAQALMAGHFPDLEVDVHELAPREAIDQLYGRTIQIALISAAAVAGNRMAFSQVPLLEDPYVLAVPPSLDLAGVGAPERELAPEALNLLGRTIEFNFGNQHNLRLEAFHRAVLPRYRIVARCRTYETALAMVEKGLGVAVVPQLTAESGGRPLFDVRLHAIPLPPRSVAAFVPSQYRHVQPFAAFLDTLKAAADALALAPPAATPPFIAARAPKVEAA
ncbi:MAG: LysR family transcriptional regulator [Geminicoccaceae bacterium]|nr:LysR family transcriptional regulator [Geminicoccaceae bacterium]